MSTQSQNVPMERKQNFYFGLPIISSCETEPNLQFHQKKFGKKSSEHNSIPSEWIVLIIIPNQTQNVPMERK